MLSERYFPNLSAAAATDSPRSRTGNLANSRELHQVPVTALVHQSPKIFKSSRTIAIMIVADTDKEIWVTNEQPEVESQDSRTLEATQYRVTPIAVSVGIAVEFLARVQVPLCAIAVSE